MLLLHAGAVEAPGASTAAGTSLLPPPLPRRLLIMWGFASAFMIVYRRDQKEHDEVRGAALACASIPSPS